MAGGMYSNISLMNGVRGLVVDGVDQAQISNLRVAWPSKEGIEILGSASDNMFSNVNVQDPSAGFDDTHDGIYVSDGFRNVFDTVRIHKGGFNSHRYAVNFSGGTGNKLMGAAEIQDGDTGRFLETVLWDNDFGPIHQLQFVMPGVLEVRTGLIRIPILFDTEIVEVEAGVAAAPTGTDVEVDVHLNGTTIFTTQGDRPIIATSSLVDKAIPNVVEAVTDDYLTVDVDQIDSNAVATDLIVTIRLRKKE